MWIRTQKNVLVNLENAIGIQTDNNNVQCDIDKYLITLGTYGTKQRALEVLEEIQEHIETRVVADNMMIKLFNTSDLGEEELRKKMRKLSCVYVMPKE